MNNLSVLWPDTLNSSPGNALGQQEEEEEISRDWDTSEAPPSGLVGLCWGPWIGDEVSASKTMIPEFDQSTTQKASDRGCVEIVTAFFTF